VHHEARVDSREECGGDRLDKFFFPEKSAPQYTHYVKALRSRLVRMFGGDSLDKTSRKSSPC